MFRVGYIKTFRNPHDDLMLENRYKWWEVGLKNVRDGRWEMGDGMSQALSLSFSRYPLYFKR